MSKIKIDYEIDILKPIGRYKDRAVININGILTMFMNRELEHLLELPEEHYNLIKQWCVQRIEPYLTLKNYSYDCGSYGIKHIAEWELHNVEKWGNQLSYVCNADIKFILSELGHNHSRKRFSDGLWYEPTYHEHMNYFYKLSTAFVKESNQIRSKQTESDLIFY